MSWISVGICCASGARVVVWGRILMIARCVRLRLLSAICSDLIRCLCFGVRVVIEFGVFVVFDVVGFEGVFV